MNIVDNGQGFTTITLSRRNLLTLLKQLDTRLHTGGLVRRTSRGTLVIQPQEDVDHYTSQDRESASRYRPGVGPDDVDRFDSLRRG